MTDDFNPLWDDRYPTLPQSLRVDLPPPKFPAGLSKIERRQKRTEQLESEEGARWFINHVKGFLEMMFRRKGEIFPMMIIIANRDPDSCKLLDDVSIYPALVEPSMVNTAEGKNGLVNWMRIVCRRADAVGWAFMVEAWMVRGKTNETVDETMAGYKQVADHPDKMECIQATLQHRALGEGTLGFSAFIKRGFKSNGQPRAQLGQWLDMPQGAVTGRFTDLLAPKEVTARWYEGIKAMQALGLSKSEMVERLTNMAEKFHPNDPHKHLLPLLKALIEEMDIE